MSDLKLTLENALKDAMRSKNEVARRTIRMALASIKNSEIEKRSMLDDTAIVAIIQKEIKLRKESIQDATTANRPDLIAEYSAEIEVIEKFLPRQLSQKELETIIEKTIQEISASLPSDLGKVMKAVLPLVQGKAPNDLVSRLIREKLQG